MNNSFNKINKQEGTHKVPSVIERKCCACNKIFNRSQFIRIMTEYNTGKIIINPNSKQFGRSIYLCKKEECLKIAIKKKRLKNLSKEDIEALKRIILQ